MDPNSLSPLAIMLEAVASQVTRGDKAKALQAARAAEPYAGLTAAVIVEALEGGATVADLMQRRAGLMRQAGVRDLGGG